MSRIIFTLFFLAIISFSFAQTKDNLYQRQWNEIDSLIFKKNLSRSALVKVNALYTLAKKNNQQVQVIKALLYKLNLGQNFEEKDINKNISFLTAESRNTNDRLTKSILSSLVAEAYKNYFEEHRWNLYQRSKTINLTKDDIATWNADDFHAAITHWFGESLLASTVLKQANIDAFASILTFNNTKVFRPTLYDLLAHRALEYFKSEEAYLSKPTYAFIINEPAALGKINTFTSHSFTTKDSASNKWKALLLLQDLIRFHKEKKDTAALIDVNLERIEFAKSNGTIANEDSLYYEAVKENAEAFKSNRYAAQAWFLLADWHAQKANSYNANGATANRFENIKALEICSRFLPLTDSTEGHYNLFNLYHRIISASIHLSTEQVNVPNAPFRTLVAYKNTAKLYYRIIKSSKKVEEALEIAQTKNGDNAAIKAAASFAYLLQQQISLPVTNDYQQHTVEIKIDALSAGKYLLLASSSANFSDTSRLALSTFYVSNISYVNNGQQYFVLDRTTGQPLKNASVQVWENQWNNAARRSEKLRKESYLSDINGYFSLAVKKDNNRNIQLQIKYGQDELFLDNNQYVYLLSNASFKEDDEADSDAEYEEDHSRAFFFKDRSIYRPGQVVYFKMIALTKDWKTKKTKLYKPADAKDSMYVYLEDVNQKRIDSLRIKLNDYSSFAGNFKLPANVLTGEFLLSTNHFDADRNGIFSVEEYKRPTFYVQLEKPKGKYRLKDSLTVTGTAKAYSGNTVDGANIKFRVTRKGRFLYPLLWYKGVRPNASETTITFGEATTDAAGKFTVKFAALPDESVSKESLPVFDFEVHADVTDIAGETRSSSTTVSVGYHSLNIKLSVKETAEADSLKSFFVSTENIAGDKEPAAVTVNIFPLQSPANLIRKRYWQQPDQYIFTAEEYRKLFPNDEYKNESDKINWAKGEAVFTSAINTKETNKVDLPKGILTAGWYLVEASATDKDDHLVKDVKYVQLYSRNDGQFSSSSYLFTAVNNNVTIPGQPASFLIGSSAADVHLIEEIQHKPKAKSTTIQSDFTFIDLHKTVKEITVTPSAEDIGGMGVNFIFVKDNRVYNVNQQVQVAEETNDLNVEVLTWRDKIEPGNEEKWTVKISGKNNEAVAAEVLTSMYDASLDQFKPHSWQVPAEPQQVFYANGWNNNSGFTDEESSDNNLDAPSKNFLKQYADIDVNLSRAYSRFINERNRYDTVRISDLDGDVSSYELRERRNGESLLPQHMKLPSPLAGRAAGVDVSSNLQDVVVVGYSTQRKANLTGSASSITLRGVSSLTGGNTPLYVVDGKIISSIDDINQEDIAKIDVLKGAEATALYGAKAVNGVVVITTKSFAGKAEEPVVKVRTNFNETAFFFPQLITDKDGSLSFTFTLPDALTQWKWQILAHDKLANFGISQKTIVSQKTLMVQANAPRFMRAGDQMQFSAKVSNLSDKQLNGKATLKLTDAITLEPIDVIFSNTVSIQNFTVLPGQSAAVSFSIAIPADFNHPITWQIVAKAGQFADGEENTLPVLTNRMLVTESLPLFVKGGTTKKFEFTKLLHQQSTTLQNESVTVEYTSNPVWYAVQSLPYLVEFPYECSEQTFNRFFANALASKIINSNPKIKQVFDEWKKDSAALKSNLQKNEELKSILLQETPWVLQAESEAQQKKNLAMLFDVFKLEQSFKSITEKLKQMQLGNGGFAWFKGGDADRYITQYIVTGIGRLQKMNALPAGQKEPFLNIANKALTYLDNETTNDYNNLKKYKADLKKNNTGAIQIQYLYTKSFFITKGETKKNSEAYNYYLQQAKQYWTAQSNYLKAMTGEVLLRNNESGFVLQNILPAIIENAVTGEETGMYWKQNEHGYYWYQAPVEQQALMIEFFSEVKGSLHPSGPGLDQMKTWLLRQKQTNHWSTTKATADACYALLLNGSDWVSANKEVSINLGSYSISSKQQKQEAGSGYFKNRIEASKVTSEMGNISVSTTSAAKAKSSSPSWGAVYWQYFEDLDKITPSATPLSISKKLFTEKNTDKGVVLQPVNNGDSLQVGDKVKIRIEIRTDRSMEYVQLKDMRAASMEPVNVLSGYKWQDGLGYYESTRDAATNFFISNLPKGTYVFEYPVTITHTGNYSVGIATAQCMYAPEFNSHSEGIRIEVSRP